MMEEAARLTCRICGKSGMKRIGFHLRKVHSMSRKEYDAWQPESSPDVSEVQMGEPTMTVEEPKESFWEKVGHVLRTMFL